MIPPIDDSVDLLRRAHAAADPPDEYWLRYGARLRDRLHTRTRAMYAVRGAGVMVVIAVIAAGVLIVRDGDRRDPELISRTERLPTIYRFPPPPPRMPTPLTLIVPPTAPPPDEHSTPVRRPPVPRDALPHLPIRLPDRIIRPADEVPVEPATAEVRAAGEIETTAAEANVLRLTDYRLLRNGVEIARGDLVEAPTAGAVWFVDEQGTRFALTLSPTAGEGFKPVATAREGLLTFSSSGDTYLWISSSSITGAPGEATVWMRRDEPRRDEHPETIGRRIARRLADAAFGGVHGRDLSHRTPPANGTGPRLEKTPGTGAVHQSRRPVTVGSSPSVAALLAPDQ